MTKKVEQDFGKLMGSYDENGQKISVYLDGNQIYFVKGGKLLEDKVFHTDDIDILLGLLESMIENNSDEG